MTNSAAARAVELLIEQATTTRDEGRYPAAISVAARAVEAADHLDATNLLLRGLEIEAGALRMTGDHAAALARYTRILGLAQDPTITTALDPLATRAIARADTDWVISARFAGGFPIRDLFGVLDAADHWLATIGHPHWRAPVLLQRAVLHGELGELDQAITAAQHALAAYQPKGPGYSLAGFRFQLGDVLERAGRAGEAVPLYQAILDDPIATAYERSVARRGLAWCALDRDEPAAAVDHARAAVDLAQAHGDEAIANPLNVLVAAYRAAGDLDNAQQAATRHLQVARRVGTHYRLYYAVRDAADVALDRNDTAHAASLLDELQRHATALDTDAHITTYHDETAERQERLTGLDPATGP